MADTPKTPEQELQENKQVVEQIRNLAGPTVAKIVNEAIDKRFEAERDRIEAGVAPMGLFGSKGAEQRGEKPEDFPGQNFARCWIVAAQCGKNPSAAPDIAKNLYGEGSVIHKYMSSDVEEHGGSAVPIMYSPEIIELLRPVAVMRGLGVRSLPLVNGNMTIPALTGGAVANYEGEGAPVFPVDPTTGKVRLISKKMRVFLALTQELISRTDRRIEEMVRDDALRAMANREDLAFIRGDGTEDTPRGMRYLVHPDNVIPAGAGDLAGVIATLKNLFLALAYGDVDMTSAAWVMNPRTWMFLWSLLDNNGNPVYQAELMTGKLWTLPYRWTNQIPRNLGVGGDESELYLANMADLIVADEDRLSVEESMEATFVDAEGNVTSAFQSDMKLFKGRQLHDFAARHRKAIAVSPDVDWGA